MKLKIFLPDRILLEEEVSKVVVETLEGSHCLKPRHIDFVAALVPGILAYYPRDAHEQFVALDQGVLVKCGDELRISTPRATPGTHLGQLRETITRQFQELDERERLTRKILANLEARFVRRFNDLAL